MVFQVNVKTLGDKVRVARAARNWSQGVVAVIAKVNPMTVSRIERNIMVDPDETKRILKALEIENEEK